MVIRVLIVDDHSIMREGLCMLLARDPDLEVVGRQQMELRRFGRPDTYGQTWWSWTC